MTRRTKEEVSKEYKQHAKDTGSLEVQVAMLTDDIQRLTEHFKNFPKDRNSKRGLMIKVGRRKTFLNYLKRKDESLYTRLVEQLAIRN